MDINEWVILSDDGFLDGDDEKQINILGKRNPDSISTTVFDKNYFCTSPKQLFHVPIELEPRFGKVTDEGLVEGKNTEEAEKIKEVVNVEADDQDNFSQVFFHIKENKLIDMKLDSPKSSGRGFFPPLDAGGLKFEDKGEAMETITSPRMNKIVETEKVVTFDCDKEEEDIITGSGFNFWKWSLTGVGAICSFGVAAATICVLFFGTQQRNKLQQDQKIQFQIYTDDKRIKQVVQHKLNEAFAAVRGVPLSRAHITYGGYYESL